MRTALIGTLLATLVVASACGTDGANGLGSTPTAPSPPPQVVTVEIAEINGPYSFYPNPVRVGSDQSVIWRNSDTVTHHVVFDQDSIDTGTLAPGTLSQPMAIRAGTWGYHCSIHPAMVGSVTVTSPSARLRLPGVRP
jgi:plastocyanin